MSEDKDNMSGGPDTGLATKTRPKTKKPAMYKVIMLNDDYTPMEFVVMVLQHFFRSRRKMQHRSCFMCISAVLAFVASIRMKWLK